VPGRTHQLELPKFIVSPSEDYPDWLLVVCPRVDCISNGMHFMVKRSTWKRRRLARDGKTVIIGRPCAYCARFAALP
jgi:hypothetical protein